MRNTQGVALWHGAQHPV